MSDTEDASPSAFAVRRSHDPGNKTGRGGLRLPARPLFGRKSPEATASTEEAFSEQQAQQAEPAQDSPYQVTIDNAQTVKTYDDTDAVCITFTFTNNSDEAQSFGAATSVTVYQDGVQQDIAFPADSPANYGNSLNKVKPGASITVDGVYALANTTSPVEVEVTELFDLDQAVLAEKTFNLS